MSKYKNIKTNGFDSKKEQRRYQELLLMQKAGKIKELKCQVPYELIPSQRINGRVVERAVRYIADFTYVTEDGLEVVEDVKPFDKKKGRFIETPEFIIKRKLMLKVHGIRIKEV